MEAAAAEMIAPIDGGVVVMGIHCCNFLSDVVLERSMVPPPPTMVTSFFFLTLEPRVE